MSESINKLDRRKFLAASLGGAMAAGLGGFYPQVIQAQDTGKTEIPEKKLITRKLGRTGMEIPIVSMGVGGTNNPGLIQAAYEKGVRMFDTAANYGYGRNEQMLGNAIQKAADRSKVFLATKILVPAQREALTAENAERNIGNMINGSLKKLKTDYIDILYVHDVRTIEDVNKPEIYETLQKYKQEQKIRAIGITAHTNMAELIDWAADSKIYDVFLTSINFTMADDTPLMNAIEKAHNNGVSIVAMKTQAGGSRWPNPESIRDHDTKTIAIACLKWVLGHESVTTSIPGYQNFQQLDEDFEVAFNVALSQQEKAFLESNDIRLGFEFCRQCRLCLASCPHNTDIPSLMRTHMYAAQYGDFYLARQTLDAIPSGNNLRQCTNCTECTAECANSVNISRKIDELKLMYS